MTAVLDAPIVSVTCDICETVSDMSKMYQCHDLGRIFYECADEKCKTRNPDAFEKRKIQKNIVARCGGLIPFDQLKQITLHVDVDHDYKTYLETWISRDDVTFPPHSRLAQSAPHLLSADTITNTGDMHICINGKHWLYPGDKFTREGRRIDITRYRIPTAVTTLREAEDEVLTYVPQQVFDDIVITFMTEQLEFRSFALPTQTYSMLKTEIETTPDLKEKWRSFQLQHIYDHTKYLDKLKIDGKDSDHIDFPQPGLKMSYTVTGYIELTTDTGYISSELSESDSELSDSDAP